MIWLLPHQLPPSPGLTDGRGGGGRRSQTFDGVKAWSFITHSILYGLTHKIIEMRLKFILVHSKM
jgi:hypothetical protein